MKPTAATKEPTINEISEKVAGVVERLLLKASLPVISHTRILQMIRSFQDKYRKLLRNIKRKNYDGKVKTFKEDARHKLFDICTCKCVFEKCACSKPRTVPPAEQDFIQDQRTLRLMCISNVDKLASKKLALKFRRKSKEQQRANEHRNVMSRVGDITSGPPAESDEDDNQCIVSDVSSIDSDGTVSWDGVFLLDSTPGKLVDSDQEVAGNKSPYFQCRRRLPALASACDRYGITDTSGAAIATAVLEDFGVVSSHDTSHVIDPSKIRRERKRKRNQLRFSQYSKIVRGFFLMDEKTQLLKTSRKGQSFIEEVLHENTSI